jgi:TetR/AcrR family acrAB operon transcriptional repressor
MKKTKEEAEKTYKDLLNAAIRVFAKQGFAATKLSEIAKVAGVTRGAIYHHFGNKQKLFNALHKEKMNPYFTLFEETMDSNLPPIGKIKILLTEVIKKAHTDISFAEQQRFNVFTDIELIDDTELKRGLKERGEKIFHRLTKVIEDGINCGDFRKSINPQIAAINLIANIKGLISLLIIEKDVPLITDHIEELADHILINLKKD